MGREEQRRGGRVVTRPRAAVGLGAAAAVAIAVAVPFLTRGHPGTAPATAAGPAKRPSPSVTRSGPAWPTVHVSMPTVRPVAMVGSAVYGGAHGPVDTGIAHVATYLQLRDSLLVADSRGRVWSWRQGTTRRVGLFTPADGISMVADPTLRTAAWWSRGHRVSVFDSAATRMVATLPPPRDSVQLFLGRSAAYLAGADRVTQVEFRSGHARTTRFAGALGVDAVVGGHALVVPDGGGDYLRPLATSSGGVQLPLGYDRVSPDLRFAVFGEERAAARDLAAHRPIPLHLPHHPNAKVSFYGWVGPDTAAYESVEARGESLFSCDLAVGTCRQTARGIPQPIIGPAGWTPPAG